MAKTKDNLKGMKVDELKAKLLSLREDLRVLHFKMEGAKSKNVKEEKSIRKQIARVLTEMKQSSKK